MSRRIVFLIDSFDGPWAGTERQLWYLLQGIDRRRFEPHLFLLRHSEFSLNATSWPCPIQVIGMERIASLDGVTGLTKLVRLLRNLDTRIVHGFFQDSSVLGPVAAKLAGAAFVAGRRDMGIWYTSLNLKVLRAMNRLVDRVIANSFAVRELVAAQEGIKKSRISVIYNGLEDIYDADFNDTASLDNRIPSGAPVVGIVANLRPVKRHADLINAFALVREKVPAVHLVVVGDGELEESLRRLADSLGLSQCIHFLGRVKVPAKIIQQFTVAVLCSESEGLSNALMEYLKEGKPVVCSDVGGNPELVTNGVNGFLYQVRDNETLACRIVQLLESKELLHKMGAAAARSVEPLTTANMVRSHIVVYESMIGMASTAETINETS